MPSGEGQPQRLDHRRLGPHGRDGLGHLHGVDQHRDAQQGRAVREGSQVEGVGVVGRQGLQVRGGQDVRDVLQQHALAEPAVRHHHGEREVRVREGLLQQHACLALLARRPALHRLPPGGRLHEVRSAGCRA